MEGGISDKKFVRVFAEPPDNDVKKLFIGIFPSNFVIRFVSFHDMISESGAKYSFVITNTDRSDKRGTNRWSFLDLLP